MEEDIEQIQKIPMHKRDTSSCETLRDHRSTHHPARAFLTPHSYPVLWAHLPGSLWTQLPKGQPQRSDWKWLQLSAVCTIQRAIP